MAVRTFKQAGRNHTTPAKATSPTVSKRGVRSSAPSTSGSPSRAKATVSRGVRGAPRDARSL